jgi:KUP system potassium uptake protein
MRPSLPIMRAIMTHSNSADDARPLLPLIVGAMGVVFGDIGTSPLYTIQQAFGPVYGLRPDAGNVLGVLSLIFWSLILIVTVKYVAIIMRADNRGEGGILALMAVVQRSLPVASPLAYTVGLLGVFGTALFFGDGVITPAMSVLSAIEGLQVAAPSLERCWRCCSPCRSAASHAWGACSGPSPWSGS